MQLIKPFKRLLVMKLNVYVLLVICLTAFVGSAQSTSTNKERIKLVKVEQEEKQDESSALKFNIEQIEKKIEHIKNNPELLKEANASGYLIELGKIKQASIEKLILLENK